MLLIFSSLIYGSTPVNQVRAIVISNGVLHQITDTEIGTRKALVLSNGSIVEQSPLTGKALVWDNGIREIQLGETLII